MADTDPQQPLPTKPAHNEQLIPSAPVQTAPEVYTGEAQSLIAPTYWDTVKENLRLIRHNSPINSWADASTDGSQGGVFLRQAAYYGLPGMPELGLDYKLTQEGKQKLSLEETRKILPHATEAMHFEIASGLAKEKRIVDSRKEMIARYGMSGWGQFALNIPLGVFAGLTEPSTYALAPLATAAGTAVGLGAGLGSVFLSNVLQNLAFEAATAPQLKREGEDVTIGSAVTSSLIGGAVGTGIHLGISALQGKGKASEKVAGEKAPSEPPAKPTVPKEPPSGPTQSPAPERVGAPDTVFTVNPDTVDTPNARPAAVGRPAKPVVTKSVPMDIQQRRFAVALMQTELGQAINPAVGEAAMQARFAGQTRPNSSPTRYEFTPLRDTGERAFFAAGAQGQKLRLVGLGGEGGVELSDNKFRQNMFGDVAETKLPANLDLLDIDTKLKAAPGIIPALEESLGRKLPSIDDHTSIRDILEHARKHSPEELELVKTAVKQAGFDGYKYADVDATGAPVHNGVVLFDEGKVQVVKEYPQDTSLIPEVSPDEVRSVLNSTDPTKTSPFYEPGIIEDLAVLDKTPSIDFGDLGTVHREQALKTQESLKQIIEADPVKNASLAEEMKMIQDEYKKEFKQAKLAKLLSDCRGGNI